VSSAAAITWSNVVTGCAWSGSSVLTILTYSSAIVTSWCRTRLGSRISGARNCRAYQADLAHWPQTGAGRGAWSVRRPVQHRIADSGRDFALALRADDASFCIRWQSLDQQGRWLSCPVRPRGSSRATVTAEMMGQWSAMTPSGRA